MTRIVATTITGHSYSWFINNSKFPLLLQSTKLLISKRCSFNIVKVQKRVTMYDVDLIRWIQNKMKLTWKLAKIVKVHRGVLRIHSNIYNCFCKVNSTVDVWLGSEYASVTVFLLPDLWEILNNERKAVKCTKQCTEQWKETRHKTRKKTKLLGLITDKTTRGVL